MLNDMTYLKMALMNLNWEYLKIKYFKFYTL